MTVVALLVCYSWSVRESAYDNAASRFDLAFSIALSGDLDIDEYHANTIDKAYYEGHYYSDKAPGVSLPAAGVVRVLSMLAPRVDWHPDDPLARRLIVLFVIALPSALSMLLFNRLAGRLSGGGAWFPMIVYALGTLAMSYSGMFYSHQLSASLLLAAFYLWFGESEGFIRRSALTGFLTGALAGYATVCEYPAAVPAAVICLVSIYDSRRAGHRVALIAGAAAAAAVLAWYNNAAFGHPLHIGYSYEAHSWFREEMGRGLGGVTRPDPAAFLKLLFMPQRGLFWGQPFLLLAAPGAFALWKAGGMWRRAAVVCAVAFLSAVLVNSAYYEPYGGFAPGPRFLVHALPFAALAAAAGWGALGGYARGIAAGAGIFSVAYYFVATAVEPHVPHIFDAPLFQFTMPLALGGYELKTVAGQMGEGGGAMLMAAATTTVFLVIYALARDTRREEVNEAAVGAVTGLMAVAVVFMMSSVHVQKDIAGGARNPVAGDPSSIRANENAALAAYYRGAAFANNGQHDRAAALFLQAASEDPDFRQAWYRLGIARIRQQNYNEAIYCFEEALLLDPGDLRARISLAAAWLAIGKAGKAVPIIHNGLLSHPGNPTLLELADKAEEMSGNR